MRFALTIVCPECDLIQGVLTDDRNHHQLSSELRKTVATIKHDCARCRYPIIARVESTVESIRDHAEVKRRQEAKDRRKK